MNAITERSFQAVADGSISAADEPRAAAKS